MVGVSRMEKVVLVDDDADVRRVAEFRLKAAGYEVLTASDGEAGLQLIRRPRPYNLHTNRHLMRQLGRAEEKWRKYLFY